MTASVVLLAGGKGLRMGLETPKQFVAMNGKLIASYALEPFLTHAHVEEIVIVCAKQYQHFFDIQKLKKRVCFASPGEMRQESLFNGLQKISGNPLVMVHDAARPFFHHTFICPLLEAAGKYGASAIGVRTTSTLKQASKNQEIQKTIDRSNVWEMQTPQVAPKELLIKGLLKARENNMIATDEASLMEMLGQTVKIIEGNALNFKVTTLADLELMRGLLNNQKTANAQVYTQNLV